MAVKFAIDRLREKAQRRHREYTALLVISNRLIITDWNRLDYEKQRISEANKAELYKAIKTLEKEIADIRKDFGFRAPNSELLKILEKVEAHPDAPVEISKEWLSEICTGYKQYDFFNALPAHALIVIDTGRFREKRGDISWFLLEAAVFEDMCALFNQAKEMETTLEKREYNKKNTKTRDSLLRMTVLVAFHFVEAYLNGLAFDHYMCNRDKISEEVQSILLDWNSRTNKPKYLSLRDKALQYPKIILGLEHPPLQEDNCPELKYVVERVDPMRHRFTHISPQREWERAWRTQQPQFYDVHVSDVVQLVDSCIGLVRKVEEKVYGDSRRLSWLHERASDGLFPDKAFE